MEDCLPDKLRKKFPHLSEFARIDEQRRALKDELKALDVVAKAHEQLAMDELVEAGIDSIKVQGRTWYLKSDRWAKKRDESTPPEFLCEFLKKQGFGHYVRTGVDWQGLSGLFRERDDSEEYDLPVPAPLAQRFTYAVGFKLASRKSG